MFVFSKVNVPPDVLLIVPPPLRAEEIVVSPFAKFKTPSFVSSPSCAVEAAKLIVPPEIFPPVRFTDAPFPIVKSEFER